MEATMNDRPAIGAARPFLNTRQAANYLGFTARHLERMRSQGTSPVYRRHGRYVVYHIDDLDAWSRARSSEEKNDG
jgi:excisionase family DNA binding protein